MQLILTGLLKGCYIVHVAVAPVNLAWCIASMLSWAGACTHLDSGRRGDAHRLSEQAPGEGNSGARGARACEAHEPSTHGGDWLNRMLRNSRGTGRHNRGITGAGVYMVCLGVWVCRWWLARWRHAFARRSRCVSPLSALTPCPTPCSPSATRASTW